MIVRVLLVAALLVAPSLGSAQELTGTYIGYLAINHNGAAINNTTNHSMQYSESGAMPFSCDLYYPGTPAEAMTLEATGGGSTIRAVNQYGATEIPTTVPAAVSGRTLTWTGTYTSGSITIEVAETLRFEAADRFVTVQTTLTNRGAVDLTDVYFMRSGDPDQGQCSIGGAFDTNNDVLRQQPGDGAALATATGGTSPAVTFGMGSYDDRARANNGGFMNTNASGAWNAPVDQGGMVFDEDIGLVFREASLPVGMGTTFVFYYLWGPDPATVASRFDTVSCSAGMPCDDGLFCTSGDVCDGVGGCRGSARDCNDGLSCTSDSCNEGADRCDNPITSGCVIGGVCRGPGSTNPMNACLVCDPSMTQMAWSTTAAGSPCDDGQFCTTGETCNGAGACSGSPRGCGDSFSCTADFCDEAADACMHPVTTGCLIAGSCTASGTRNPGNECEECRPGSSTTGWTVRRGEMCGSPSCSGALLTPAGTCGMTGECNVPEAMPCPGGALCADAFSCTGMCGSDAECAAGDHCTGGRCVADLGGGEACDRAAMCATAGCADGVCCDSACDGVCQACDLPGMIGTCTLHATGTDPESECADPETCDMGTCRALPMMDAGPADAGAADAGPPDAGRPPQADGGAIDSGPRPDGARLDGSSGDGYSLHGSGLLCAAGPPARPTPGWLLLFGLGLVLISLRFRRAR